MIINKFYQDDFVCFAAVLGGSGSVGKQVLNHLLQDINCTGVTLVSRRPLEALKALDERISVEVCTDLNDMTTVNLRGANVAFCTLGIGAASTSTKDELLRVDGTLPSNFAQVCAAAGVTHYCLMTSVGANEKAEWSRFSKCGAGGGWYNHVKGVAEQNTIGHNMPYTFIAQPAILLGSPHTPTFLNYLPHFLFPSKYSSANVIDIASGMVKATVNAFQNNTNGVVRITGGVPISKAE